MTTPPQLHHGMGHDRELSAGGRLNYSTRIKSKALRRVSFPGIVTSVQPDRRIVFEVGVPAVLKMTFRFELEPSAFGSRFEHLVQVGGLLTPLLKGRLGPIIGAMADGFTGALTRRFPTKQKRRS